MRTQPPRPTGVCSSGWEGRKETHGQRACDVPKVNFVSTVVTGRRGGRYYWPEAGQISALERRPGRRSAAMMQSGAESAPPLRLGRTSCWPLFSAFRLRENERDRERKPDASSRVSWMSGRPTVPAMAQDTPKPKVKHRVSTYQHHSLIDPSFSTKWNLAALFCVGWARGKKAQFVIVLRPLFRTGTRPYTN